MAEGEMTPGVKNLLGEPKKAILKISIPMMVGMTFQTLYNIVDGIWVAGLGADELAAIGLVFPFFMVLGALGAGLGIGGSSAVSRRIGADEKKEAEETALHTLFISVLLALAVSLPVLPFMNTIFRAMGGGGRVSYLAADYARVIFLGSVFMLFSYSANAVLRGEGDTKRAMYALIFGNLLNIVLDPLFIYVLGMGVVGAAVATVVSIAVSCLLFIYWLFIKGVTYLKLNPLEFRFSSPILRDILSVGIPSSLSQLSMSFSIIVLNGIIVHVSGTDGVAVFTSGWRIVMLGTIPLLGLASGVTAVIGAAYGARDREKLETAYIYAVKIGIIIELSLGGIIALFAPQVSTIFTYSKGSERIAPDLIEFLRISVLFYPAVPLGMLTSAMFQGVGRGFNSLAVTILRTFLFQLTFSYLIAIALGVGLTGVWFGIAAGNWIAGLITFLWGRITVDGILPRSTSAPA